MFVSDTHLPQLLDTADYSSPEVFERELELLFRPRWHCVGALTDLPKDGDFITTDFLGRPLIVWRHDGKPHAFLNVCAHRFSQLSDKPCGHMHGRLKCQYHGWEYDETGNTKRIPDAASFKPLKKGELGLTPFRCETVGQLIFVTLNPEAPPLAEYLGELHEVVERTFSLEHRLCYRLDQDHEANWKAIVENTLESYHIEMVHAKTFGTAPPEDCCTHEFHGQWDLFVDDYRTRGGFLVKLERAALKLAGQTPTSLFRHRLRYPNLEFADASFFSWSHTMLPLSPTRTRTITRVFCNTGPRRKLRSRLMSGPVRLWGRGFYSKFIAEDARLYPALQRGLNSIERPLGGGLISTREERVFHFQEYVKSALAEDRETKIEDRESQEATTAAEVAANSENCLACAAPTVSDREPRDSE